MYLEKKNRNKLTIGKMLRKEKGLRKRDPVAEVLPPTLELQQYRKELERRGMKVGPMDLGLFRTKNGLKYTGFIARQKIPTNSVLLRVPVDCLLTTRDAFLSQIQKVFEENPKFYAKAFSSDWQDRILLTYLLFEYQRGKDSKWYHLLKNLPRQIDYVIYWSQSELAQLQDSWIAANIKKERQKVSRQQQQLLKIASKYPQFFDMQVFTIQNMQWIHTHLVTRCFGKYFEYTTMVPYAQLFNHECIDVYYTMDYKPQNPHNPKQQLDPPKIITQEEEDEADTSEGSYEASDVSAQDDDFREIQLKQYEVKQHSVESQIRSLHSYLMTFIAFNDGVSLPFLQKTYQQMQKIRLSKQDTFILTKKLQKVHANNVKYLKLVKQFYYKLGFNTYNYSLRQRKKNKENELNKKQQQPNINQKYFQGAWPKDKFDQFLMICSTKDQFEAGSQVYFCYGRLPNRLLLMRYGISLEHNKYNHLFIRIDISQLVYSCQALCRAVQQDIALKKYRKFKIKRTVFCIQLITFYRALNWNCNLDPENIFYITNVKNQKKILQLASQTLNDKLLSYKNDLKFNQALLSDSSLDYHSYFALVYKIEQQRILVQQIKMIDYALWVLAQIQSKRQLQDIHKSQTSNIRLSYQIMMQNYFKYFKLNP